MSENTPPRRSPLHEAHLAAGGRLVEFAGWLLPVEYTGLMDEHRAVRERCGLFDVSHRGELRVSGPGAEAFLQAMTPNDVARLTPGRAHYSGLLNERGGYLDDLLVYRLAADDFLLVVNAANAARDREWLEAQAAEGVRLRDESDEWALLALQGPASESILQPLTGADLPGVRYYRFVEAEVAGTPAIVSRTGYTGEDGFELYLPSAAAPAVWRELLAAGAGAGLVPAGLGARDTLRLEAAMALYGHELDETTTPFEAGLDWVVKLGKGAFVGSEALAAQRANGLQRRLVGFEIAERGIARQGHEVMEGDREVGVVTSGTFSPTFERALGLAYVPARLAEPGTAIELQVRKRRLAATVVEIPFYRRAR